MENKSKREIKQEFGELRKPIVWDCGSSLYDSFELESFERKLHSAINSRTLSMPHLSDRRVLSAGPPPPASQPHPSHDRRKSQYKKKLSSKISRSIFHRLLCFVHKPKQKNSSSSSLFQSPEPFNDGYHVGGRYGYDTSESFGLSAIPESPEGVNFSPEFGSRVVRRTTSERFRASSMSISCA